MKNLLFLCPFLFAGPILAQNTSTELGRSYAALGDLIVAGQPASDGATAALHVFARGTDGWDLTHSHVIGDVQVGDGYANTMDMDGELLAVSAPYARDSSGTLYVYRHDGSGGNVELVERFVEDQVGGQLGYAIDLKGDVLVAGMPGVNAALVVHGLGTDEPSKIVLTPEDAAPNDFFGGAVATDGERIYVGAPRRSDHAGSVYVFAPSENGYMQEAIVEWPDNQAFGRKIIASGSGRFITSAPGLSIQERRASGQRQIRVDRNAMPGPVLEVVAAEEGWTVHVVADSLSDFILIRSGNIPIAATEDEVFIGLPQSRVIQGYKREPSSGAWVQAQEIQGADGDAGFGAALAIHDETLSVLASRALYGLGGIVVYSRTESGFERDQRLMLVEDFELTQSGRVDCQDGSALQFGCNNVDMLAFMPIGALAGQSGTSLNDIWGWTDPMTGSEYALVGRSDGTAFVDVSDPSNPILIGDLPLTEGARPSSWRDIKVFGDHAFIVADGAGPHGMQVFDLSQLRSVETMPAAFTPVTVYDQVGSAHNIVINEETGTAYIVGVGGSGETCGGGLHMVNIQDPANPTFEGCFADMATGRQGTGYTHDAQCVIYHGPDTEYQGREICFNANETALSIADVTVRDSTVAVSNASYPAVRYAHQGWLSEDQTYFFMNDEIDEVGGAVDGTRTLIWNVSDLEDPQLEREYISSNTSSDHNLYIRDNLMYQSNYASGLRIFDVSDPLNPVEVGFFDPISIVPDAPGFIGSWSNYPYFESGTIVITSIGEGLFVLKRREVDT